MLTVYLSSERLAYSLVPFVVTEGTTLSKLFYIAEGYDSNPLDFLVSVNGDFYKEESYLLSKNDRVIFKKLEESK